jgi:DNA-binding transcriptional LysR family regulator
MPIPKSRKKSKLVFEGFEMRDEPRVGMPSLDQLQVFLTVVETGSFAAAGRRLKRATSAVSYAIANLELQLGLALFDRQQTRKPVLTEAGTAMLSKARAVAGRIDDLRATAKGLLGGLEAEVSLVVDVMLPTARLVDAVRAFEAQFSTVTLRVYVEALSAVGQLVEAGIANIGVGGMLHTSLPGIERVQVGQVDMIPVAAAEHPLTRRGRRRPGEANRFRQLVLTVRSSFAEGQDFGIYSAATWRLADLGAKHALLIAGSGWGFMPEPMVRDDIASGCLVRLSLPDVTGGPYPLQAIYRADHPPGPAAEWLIQRFVDQAKQPGRR